MAIMWKCSQLQRLSGSDHWSPMDYGAFTGLGEILRKADVKLELSLHT